MLPPKDPNEEKKHLQQHQAMMKKAKLLGKLTYTCMTGIVFFIFFKKVYIMFNHMYLYAIEAKKEREHHKRREEKDKKMSQALQIWEDEILTNWSIRYLRCIYL